MRLESLSFDEKYLDRLINQDRDAEARFAAYFQKPIWVKARRQLRTSELADDACQETLFRVLRYFRSGKRLNDPARLPAFVHTVCANVILEMIRANHRFIQLPEDAAEPPDLRIDLHRDVVTEERKQMVREVLDELPERDRDLLGLILAEDADRAEISARFDTNEDYLRVLVHRARLRFKAALLRLHPEQERARSSGAE